MALITYSIRATLGPHFLRKTFTDFPTDSGSPLQPYTHDLDCLFPLSSASFSSNTLSLPPSKSHSPSQHVLFPLLLENYIVSKVYQEPQPMPCQILTPAPNSQNILYFTWYFSSLNYLIALRVFWWDHELLRAGCLPHSPNTWFLWKDGWYVLKRKPKEERILK